MKFSRVPAAFTAFLAIHVLTAPAPELALEVALSIKQEAAKSALLTTNDVLLIFGSGAKTPEYHRVPTPVNNEPRKTNFTKPVNHITLFGAAACSIFGPASSKNTPGALHTVKISITSFESFPVSVPVCPPLQKDFVICKPVTCPCGASSTDSFDSSLSCPCEGGVSFDEEDEL